MTRVREIRECCDGRVPYALYRPGQSYPCGKVVSASTDAGLDILLKSCGWKITPEGALCGDCVHHGRGPSLMLDDTQTKTRSQT